MATVAKSGWPAIIFAVFLLSSECVVLSPSENKCGGHLTNRTGTITSPGYPNAYPVETSCEWTIVTDEDLGIAVTVREFQLDSGGSLQISDNDPLFDSNKLKWPALTGSIREGTVFFTRFNRMWLVFTSNQEKLTQKAKFRLQYRATETTCPDISAPKNGSRTFKDTVHGYTVSFFCDAGYVLQGNASLTCGSAGAGGFQWSGLPPTCVAPCFSKTAEGEDGKDYYSVPSNKPVILSPNYPSPVGNPGKCSWKIRVDRGLYVDLTATTFELDRFSYLEIWDRVIGARLLGNYSGNLFPRRVTSNSNTVFITLYSKGVSNGYFNLKYVPTNSTDCAPPPSAENMYFTPVKVAYPVGDMVRYKCMAGFVLAPKNSHNTRTRCSVGKRWTVQSLPKCVAYCKEWDPDDLTYRDMVYRNGSGVIYSPGYPGPLKKGSCEYRIEVHLGHSIEFDLTKVTLDSFTKLMIYSAGRAKNRTLLVTVSRENLPNITSYEVTDANVSVVIQKSDGESSTKFLLRYSGTTYGDCEKPVIDNGYIRTTVPESLNTFSVFTYVSLACAPFFRLQGASEVMCEPGRRRSHWVPVLPSCVSRCGGSFPYLSNGTIFSPPGAVHCTWHISGAIKPQQKNITYSVSISMETLDLETTEILRVAPVGGNATSLKNKRNLVILTSSAGFRLTYISIDRSFTSGSRFRLSYQSEIYVHKSCQIPSNSSHLLLSSGDALPGSSATFRCEPPYNLVGKEEVTCSAEVPLIAWNPSLPSCSLDCGLDGEGQFIRNATIGGAIANPGYPSMIRGKQDCRWVIRARPGYRVTASFSYLDFPKEHKDVTIRIYDGTKVRHQKPLHFVTEYGVLPPNVTSLSGAMTVHFVCTRDDLRANKGFYITYGTLPLPPLLTTTGTTAPTGGRQTPEPTTTKAAELPTVVVHTLPGKSAQPTTSKKQNEEQNLGRVLTHVPYEVSPGIIIAVVIISIVFVVVGVVGGFFWYRRRHPARMMVGQRFPKFHNPIYDHQPSTSSTFSLERDFNMSSASSSTA